MPVKSESSPVIAIVAMVNSIHVARWLGMVRDCDLRFVVIPVMRAPPIGELAPFRLVSKADDLCDLKRGELGVFDHGSVSWAEAEAVDFGAGFKREEHPAFQSSTHVVTAHHVTSAIRALDPDLVHSMEVQVAGYLTLEAKRRMGAAFPRWLLSNWGSDIQLFVKLPAHRPIIHRLFGQIDAYWAECGRDVALARRLGYEGVAFDPIPASGGMRVDGALAVLPPSQRRSILVKGYHGWSGRGLHILSAIYLAAPQLRSNPIRVLFTGPQASGSIAEIRQAAGLDIEAAPHLEQHADAMRRLAEARVVVGTGISDGIGTTLLEAMSVGTFPIVANTSCASEWVRNGRDAFIVDPHDTAAMAEALVRAVQDDELVDAAALRNRDEVSQRWDPGINRESVLAAYASLIEAARASRAS
ncbi:glycosyl transferase group 1 [Methylobacterium nodulans ORS 2060]|uniref:Glycosyl transferase group 1 n=2 Tax=Methylobacterium nodulans TaxID=114616 RepID=B8IAF4_METNO|nr:glycosyl transferase group 1 [Methylobacterium nodulans ORS 2060]